MTIYVRSAVKIRDMKRMLFEVRCRIIKRLIAIERNELESNRVDNVLLLMQNLSCLGSIELLPEQRG